MEPHFDAHLDTSNLEDMTETGKALMEGYLKQSEEHTDKEMLEKLSQCNGNHYWTQDEKECLVYFSQRCEHDMDKLHEDFFPHRTVGALKTRYTKILRGEDTPATTPRLSVGAIISNAANEAIKAVTPRKPIKAIQQIEEEEQLAEDMAVEETLSEDALPEVNVEKDAVAEATTEETTKTEESAEGLNYWLLAVGPIVLVYLILIFVVVLPNEHLPPQVLTFKSNLLTNFEFYYKTVRSKLNDLL